MPCAVGSPHCCPTNTGYPSPQWGRPGRPVAPWGRTNGDFCTSCPDPRARLGQGMGWAPPNRVTWRHRAPPLATLVKHRVRRSNQTNVQYTLTLPMSPSRPPIGALGAYTTLLVVVGPLASLLAAADDPLDFVCSHWFMVQWLRIAPKITLCQGILSRPMRRISTEHGILLS